jgi:hypothetical protein
MRRIIALALMAAISGCAGGKAQDAPKADQGKAPPKAAEGPGKAQEVSAGGTVAGETASGAAAAKAPDPRLDW